MSFTCNQLLLNKLGEITVILEEPKTNSTKQKRNRTHRNPII
jgi:hypothetical protein